MLYILFLDIRYHSCPSYASRNSDSLVRARVLRTQTTCAKTAHAQMSCVSRGRVRATKAHAFKRRFFSHVQHASVLHACIEKKICTHIRCAYIICACIRCACIMWTQVKACASDMHSSNAHEC
jgi:hypothetical protein